LAQVILAQALDESSESHHFLCLHEPNVEAAVMLFATMHNARKRREETMERTRQQQKARAQKNKDKEKGKEATFEQHRCSFHSPAVPSKEGLELHRLSSTIGDSDALPAMFPYRRSSTCDGIEGGFTHFRRSLNIPSSVRAASLASVSCPDLAGQIQGSRQQSIVTARRSSHAKDSSHMSTSSMDSIPFSKTYSLTSARSQASTESSHAKDDFYMSTSNMLEGAIPFCKSYSQTSAISQASTTSGIFVEDDDDEFSQTNTTAGAFADEGLTRIVLHG